jgi:hypothetical protein
MAAFIDVVISDAGNQRVFGGAGLPASRPETLTTSCRGLRQTLNGGAGRPVLLCREADVMIRGRPSTSARWPARASGRTVTYRG